ncbi:MAG: hypothetical protein KC766_09135, partial [Myxococcales bacterium]|nr:hypothetical protein [Myxococcales bacterium]
LRGRLQRGRATHTALERRLLMRDPKAVLARTRLKLAPLERALRDGIRARLQRERKLHADQQATLVRCTRDQLHEHRERLSLRATELDGLSPLRILGRGYAIAAKAGHIVRRARELAPGDDLEVRLGRGSVRTSVTSVDPGEEQGA